MQKLDVSEGICVLCNLNKVEDKKHFVMRCPISELFGQVEYQYPSFSEMNEEFVFSPYNAKLQWIFDSLCTKVFGR